MRKQVLVLFELEAGTDAAAYAEVAQACRFGAQAQSPTLSFRGITDIGDLEGAWKSEEIGRLHLRSLEQFADRDLDRAEADADAQHEAETLHLIREFLHVELDSFHEEGGIPVHDAFQPDSLEIESYETVAREGDIDLAVALWISFRVRRGWGDDEGGGYSVDDYQKRVRIRGTQLLLDQVDWDELRDDPEADWEARDREADEEEAREAAEEGARSGDTPAGPAA